jgi:hypothetical protein
MPALTSVSVLNTGVKILYVLLHESLRQPDNKNKRLKATQASNAGKMRFFILLIFELVLYK